MHLPASTLSVVGMFEQRILHEVWIQTLMHTMTTFNVWISL